MRAVVKWTDSPDVVDSGPADLDNFRVLIELGVGSDETSGVDTFGVVVCTPQWLAQHVSGEGRLLARHHLVVGHWDWDGITEYLTQLVEAEQAPSWNELARRVGRIGHWEFEDMPDATIHQDPR